MYTIENHDLFTNNYFYKIRLIGIYIDTDMTSLSFVVYLQSHGNKYQMIGKRESNGDSNFKITKIQNYIIPKNNKKSFYLVPQDGDELIFKETTSDNMDYEKGKIPMPIKILYSKYFTIPLEGCVGIIGDSDKFLKLDYKSFCEKII